MQLKPITAIIVLSLVVASLLVAGCTSNTASPTPAATVATTKEPTVTPTTDRPSLDQIIEQQKTQKTPTAEPAPTVATPAPTAAPSKPSASGFVLVEVNSMTTSSQTGSYPLQSTPTPGRTFAVYDVTLTNQNKNNLYMGNPLYFKLTTSDSTVYQYSSASFFLDNHLTGVFNTNPGDKVTGKIAFEIPQSAKVTKLSYGDLINGVVTVNL
jgi:hypothetical protein